MEAENRRLKKIFQEHEHRYQDLVEKANDGLGIIQEWKFKYLNPRLAQMAGYTVEEVLETPFTKYIHPDELPKVMNRYKRRMSGEVVPSIYESAILTKDGNKLLVEFSVCPIPYKGKNSLLVFVRDITGRKMAEKALEESEERYRDLVEKTRIGILIDDRRGNFQYINEPFARMFGYAEEEMRTLSIQDIVHPDDVQMVMRYHRNRVQGRRAPSRYEFRGVKKNGTLIYLEVDTQPLKRAGKIVGTCSYIWDITKRKLAEKALEQSEEKYKTIAENVDVGIYRTTAGSNGRFVEANPAMLRMFGYRSKKEFMKTAVNCLYQNSEDREKFQKKMDRDGFVKDEELALRRKDGTGFLGEVCAVAIRDEKGHVRFYDGIVEDITERKRAEEKLRASLKEKEVLLREIHHRVKNNLQIISSLLNLQSRYIRDPSALEMFKESRDRVRSMALVHEKLYSSEDMANVDFSEYIQSLARHLCMAYGMNANGITVDVEARDVCLDINTSIPCGLIINELISNALKHAFRGRKRGKIRILLRQEQPDRYRMVVSDDGVGLPKDLDVQRVKSLGLQLVCMLVEQLQGEMTIKSGKGTSFEIAFRGLS